jgi:hypothetical protein
MPHHLMNPHGPVLTPLMITLRYQCGCTNKEVITINTVVSAEMMDDHIGMEYLFQTMLKDMKIEIRQHLKQTPEKPV